LTESEVTLAELAVRHTLSIDHQLAMRAALRRLAEEFSGMFNRETVERFLTGSYEQYAAKARLPHYVHLLAERYARARLTAFAVAERHLVGGTPIVVFVCRKNDLFSPMARGLFARRAGDAALAWSAGIDPAVVFRTGVEDVLREVGVSLVDDFPKPLAPEMLRAATVVVTFGCEAECPVVPGREYVNAKAPEPPNGDLEALRRIRTWLDDGVSSLADRVLHLPAT
jgi:protein-tyrosine-phosphatase